MKRLEDGGAGLRLLNLGGETVDTKSANGELILTVFPPSNMTGVDVKYPIADHGYECLNWADSAPTGSPWE
jgi:hypothetical protein